MSDRPTYSRRNVIAGMAAAPLLVSQSLASLGKQEAVPQNSSSPGSGTTGSLDVPRFEHASAPLANGQIMVTGGYHLAPDARKKIYAPASASVQILDPSSGEWSQAASMNHPRARHAAALLNNGKVLVAGGYSMTALDSIELYDPMSDSWTVVGHLPRPMADVSAAASGSGVVITGEGNSYYFFDLGARSLSTRP